MKHTTKGTVKINTIFNTHDNVLLRLYLFFSYVIFGKITLAIANEKIVGILIKLETAPLSKPYKNTDTLFEKLIDNKLTTKMLSIKPDIGKTIFVKVIGTADIQLNKRPKGSPIKIKLNYDDNSVVNVSVIDDTDDSLLNEVKINRLQNLTEDEVNIKQRRIDNIDIEG